jgi:cytochrome c oxidase assembly protein subunit 15
VSTVPADAVPDSRALDTRTPDTRTPDDGTDDRADGGPARSWWRRRPSRTWVRRILVANLVGQVAIVVTGGIVRLTASGLGCSTWPQCEPGQFTPTLHDAASWHPFIEFGNRTITGVLGVLALATAWAVWPRRDRALPYRLLGVAPLLGVVIQALVGGVIVLADLHPGWVATHFLISMALVAASTALLRRDAEGDGVPRPLVSGRLRALALALVPLAVVVLVLGVITTGAGPHSGDDEVGYRFAIDPALMSRVHAGAVWLFAVGVVALTMAALRGTGQTALRRAAVVLAIVTAAQGVVGYVQYFTGLPEVLVAVHMLGASLLVVALVDVLVALRQRTT